MHEFSLTQRSLIADLASVIFPRTPTMPSAADVHLAEGLLDDVLRARPDLITPLCAILDRVGAQTPSTFMSRLAEDEPARFSVLMQIVAGAYYLDPRVRAAIGYTGQKAAPLPKAIVSSSAFAQHTSRDRIRYRSV